MHAYGTARPKPVKAGWQILFVTKIAVTLEVNRDIVDHDVHVGEARPHAAVKTQVHVLGKFKTRSTHIFYAEGNPTSPRLL